MKSLMGHYQIIHRKLPSFLWLSQNSSPKWIGEDWQYSI